MFVEKQSKLSVYKHYSRPIEMFIDWVKTRFDLSPAEAYNEIENICDILSNNYPMYLYEDTKKEKFIAYLCETVVPHKIAVYEAGIELLSYFGDQEIHVHQRLIAHDLSKFSLFEMGYADMDFKDLLEFRERKAIDIRVDLVCFSFLYNSDPPFSGHFLAAPEFKHFQGLVISEVGLDE